MIKLNKNEIYWHNLFNSFSQSGQTIKKFCNSNNISLNQFVYWRKKFLLVPKKQKSLQNFKPNLAKLREIKISKSKPEQAGENIIRIILPNKISIAIPVNLAAEKFTTFLMKMQEALC